MKLSNFSTIILIHLTISSILFISPIQSHSHSDAHCNCPPQPPSLLEQICRKTPDYNLCISALKPHKHTSIVEIAAFARITLEAVATQARAILKQVQNISAQTKEAKVKIALENCFNSYGRIVKEVLPGALGCMDKNDFNCVKNAASVIDKLTDSCEKECNAAIGSGSTSPMGDNNLHLQNMCAITVSIVTKVEVKVTHQTLN